MVLKWLREKPEGWALRLTVNLIGAVISFIVMSMFFLTKFAQVWSILIFLPVIIFLFHRIKKHYDAVGDQLSLKLASLLFQLRECNCRSCSRYDACSRKFIELCEISFCRSSYRCICCF